MNYILALPQKSWSITTANIQMTASDCSIKRIFKKNSQERQQQPAETISNRNKSFSSNLVNQRPQKLAYDGFCEESYHDYYFNDLKWIKKYIQLNQYIIFYIFYNFYKIMHSNIWNLKKSKERLDIMQKTQAHKRHLISILSVKSNIDNHTHLKHRYNNSTSKNNRDRDIQKENLNMVSRIAQQRQSPRSANIQFACLSRNLKTYSSLNRIIKQRQIQTQNSKIFSRLIMTSPTINRGLWMRDNRQNSKYKQNMHRTKYIKPDYSQQAVRLISQEPKFHCLTQNIKKKPKKFLKKIRKFQI